MPRKPKPPRIRERQRNGRTIYTIRHGSSEIGTSATSREAADLALARYIQEAQAAERVQHREVFDPEQMTCADALAIYAEEHAPHKADPARIGYAIEALLPFWGIMRVSAINGATCRRYARERGRADETIRRELGTLRAALRYCQKEGYLTRAPDVVLPEKGNSRDLWLTRPAAAILLRASRQLRVDGRHLQWFIIGSLYTGTRKAAMLSIEITAQPTLHHGRLDPESGYLYRSGQKERQTKKRRGVAKAPRQLIAHARRKQLLGHRWFVQDNQGKRLADIRKGFDRAKMIAQEIADAEGYEFDFSEITPHTLKHTAITWAMQRGTMAPDAASYFATSLETIMRVYWHHHPDHQKSAVAAMESGGNWDRSQK